MNIFIDAPIPNPKLPFYPAGRAAAEQSNAQPRGAVCHPFNVDYGLMVERMTTNKQMYISYLHSRFQRGVLITGKYVGQRCITALSGTLSPALQILGSSPNIFPPKPAVSAENKPGKFLSAFFELVTCFFFLQKVSQDFMQKAFGLKPF